MFAEGKDEVTTVLKFGSELDDSANENLEMKKKDEKKQCNVNLFIFIV